MSGRYKSKLFNFLSRQSLRLRHQSAQTWREVKVAAVWGVQILLYPVYVAFQSARLFERQLQQAARRTIPRLRSAARALQAVPPLPVDAPIQHLLQSLSQLEVHLLSDSTASQAPDLALALTHSAKQPHRLHTAEVLVATAGITSSIQVRGLASMLGTGSLVLVTAENRILDILTPLQQTHLTQRMAWELASYWRQQRQLEVPQAQPLSTYLPLPKPQQNALLPIRAWRGLMAWMQRSAVAVSANLFQESRLQELGLQELRLQESRLIVPKALPSASPPGELRSAQPVWEMAEAQFYDWLAQTGRRASSLFTMGWEAGKTALAKRSWQEGVHQFRAMLPAAQFLDLQPETIGVKHHAQPIPADWLAILDRWVSELPGLKATPTLSTDQLSAGTSAPVTTPDPRPGFLPSTSSESWLKRSLRSLMSNPLTHREVEATEWEITDTAALEAAIKGQSQSGIVQSNRPNPLQPGAFSEWDSDHGMGHPLRRRHPIDVPLTSLDTANAEESAMVPQSWIETEAQLVAYVKHPLEQLLEWLDHGMLWVEQRLSQLWQWLNRPIL